MAGRESARRADGLPRLAGRDLRYICKVRSAGVRRSTPRRPSLRRILMTRTNNHVYFVIDDATETVHVHAVWGAPKGRTPKL